MSETFARARVLAEQLDRLDHPIVHGQWIFHLVRAELRLTLWCAEQVEKIAEARNDPTMLLLGRLRKGLTSIFLGEFAAARALLEQGQGLSDVADRALYAALISEDPYSVILGLVGLTLTCLGYINQGGARIKQAMSEARRLQHSHTLAFALTYSCWVERVVNSPHDMQRYAEQVVALSKEHGFPFWLNWGTMYQGCSLTALGQTEEGIELLTQGLAVCRGTGAVVSTPVTLTMLAEAYAKLGKPMEGLNCLTEAAQIIETTDERYGESELHRLRGDLLNATGEWVAAEENYHLALAVAERQSTKTFELRAATRLACLWRDQGKRSEARDLLAPIYGWFTEGFDTPVLQDAKALLGQLI